VPALAGLLLLLPAASSPAAMGAPARTRASASTVAAGLQTLYVATTGRDDNRGTISEPLLTPAAAVSNAGPGATIWIKSGTYSLNRSLLIDKPGLRLRSLDGRSARLRGPTDEPKGFTSVIVIAASNVALIGLDIEGGSYYGIKVDADPGHSTSGVSIKDCRIHNTGRDCIKTFNADQLAIEDCDIGPSGVRDPSNAEGIDSIGSVGVIIRRCRIHDTATNGLYLKGGARDGIVEQCRVENVAGFAGILLGEDTDAEFMRDRALYEAINCVARNNIIINTGAAGLGTYSGFNIRFENNTLYQVAGKIQAAFWIVTDSRKVPAERIRIVNNISVMSGSRPFLFAQDIAGKLDCDWNIYFNPRGTEQFVRETTGSSGQYLQSRFADWQKLMGVDSHSIIGNPLLNPQDSFRPMPGSPAIDRGTELSGVGTDYRGSARPKGAACDIGATQHEADNRAHAVPQ